MTRKTKANSTDGAVKAMQNVLAEPLQPPWALTKRQKVIWAEIIERRARDEWQPVDLRFAGELAGVLVRLREEERLLAKEGTIIFGERGAKLNPRDFIVRGLSRRAMWLAQYLRIHPASDADHPTKVIGGRKAEQDARVAVASPKRATVSERRRARLLPMQ